MTNLKTALKSYDNTMYDLSDVDRGLVTGDILKLDVDFFKKFSKYDTIIPLFENFLKNEDYSSNYWAILNKPCDMVHDDYVKRSFDRNMFLCPLKNFKTSFYKNELLEDCALHGESIESPYRKIYQLYSSFVKDFVNEEYPFEKGVGKEKEEERRSTISETKKSMIEYFFGNVFADETIEYDFVFSFLEGYMQQEEGEDFLRIQKFIDKYKNSKVWRDYGLKLEESAVADSNVKIKKSKLSKISNFVLNQNDSLGTFFYEPNLKISSMNGDLCYYIELEDLITFKVDSNFQSSGELVEFLKKVRVLKVSDNFSDRLLNIMGNYFSKIGTTDIPSTPILRMYGQVLKDNFSIVGDEESEENKAIAEIVKKLKLKELDELQTILKKLK